MASKIAEAALREITLAHTSGAYDLVEQNDVEIVEQACRAWAVKRLRKEGKHRYDSQPHAPSDVERRIISVLKKLADRIEEEVSDEKS